ncbi:MAG: SecY-interacting protein [Motiliproteus sp.]
MSSAVEQALDRFVQSHLEQNANQPPQIEFDSEWPSECYQSQPNSDGQVDWQPVRQQQHNDLFERLEQALEVAIHPDIKAYYDRYWSDPLPAQSPEGQLNLLFVWNPEDLERLRANLIGHALGRQRLKQPLSFFFGCTSPEEFVLAIDNDSGQVMLEQPGKRKSDLIAPSLAEFIDQLTPLANQ